MKIFEHEVLTFDAGSRKGSADMENTLREWGAMGWEVVSAVPHHAKPQGFLVFIKRETIVRHDESEEAA